MPGAVTTQICLLCESGSFSLLKTIEIDLFIFSCEGIDTDGIMWDSNPFNAEFKTMLLKRATQSILLIDKSKMCRTGEVKIGTLDDVEQVISNIDAE